ncbi:hypothetical protein BDN72DRAFT_888209 [Pluteus cervinus]|uniref:Uncharacterized protein n=1 Tax=Pluteus cervinus TaxID=181527 RepID=A0ACD3AVS3_9AGAR|nr:hypothetical protein BDN72DRAFT_888209 [Pluteus cervinus]
MRQESSFRAQVDLKPTAGFCVKSTTLQPAVYPPSPSSLPSPDHIPPGFKVFVNIAWDPNVPSPPEADEQTIQNAMQGEDPDSPNPEAWYVPVIVSEGRPEKDKAGKPSLVFDCVFHKSVRTRTLHDPKFKLFIVELALQRIEAQNPLVLSRQIGTPNVASKGPLHPRTVSIPSFLAPDRDVPPKPTATRAPLIQEVETRQSDNPIGLVSPSQQDNIPLSWSWKKVEGKLQIRVQVPRLAPREIQLAALDVEHRRILLQIPNHPLLDINLEQSDAEITASMRSSAKDALQLKRQRDLDVEGATAEWHMVDNALLITA